ncbi:MULTISPECIES: gamma-glutamylcyclotransferase family protein [unclassified Streptomyces]|uniref:gamma-glutamylcyclotransferase family protein n=1 Tax=unclassified Streptomyces TaxID=2593676 RepID=UPI002DDB1AC0|nr:MULTISPECIES: gamma-glutamylcyclotransferase family protein [unclassified Streptomyces]WSA94871.1 gamma-glutamylcyclotransferase [Streptomyces sp. NBC_01795]WSB79291.1 gamma-glutamylcyclotransferase [Streptomyces sp. NBC_01775]WSS41291.1 gamma-glutamylcyclotransferase [Streptomyces sp. NBC_01187]
MTDPSRPAAEHPPRLAAVRPATDVLFVYGTLRFRRILAALLGRVPAAAPATVDGWRTAALRNRPYPGLVRAEGHTASGLLLSGLNAREWRVLDDFEDDEYELRRLPLAAGGAAVGNTEASGKAEASGDAEASGGTAVGGTAGGPGEAWAYLWISPGEVRADTWEADTFAGRQLDTYARRLEVGTDR